MIITERNVRRRKEGARNPSRQCETPGCNHSARYDACFLKAYHVLLCSHCRREYEKAYDNALRGWPDEDAHHVAAGYRAAQAAVA